MPQIHRLTEEDIAHSSTLDGRDVVKWVWVAIGCLMGFTDTRPADDVGASQGLSAPRTAGHPAGGGDACSTH